MTRPIFGLLLVVAALLQAALLPRWQFLAVTPGLVVVLILVLLGTTVYFTLSQSLMNQVDIELVSRGNQAFAGPG